MLPVEVFRLLILAIFLIIGSLVDIKKKSVSGYYLVFGILGMLFMYLIAPFNVMSLVVGIVTGLGVILIAWASKEAIGVGDGLVLLMIGIGVGSSALYVFLYSLVAVSLFSVILMKVKHKKRKFEIPLIPFYLFGFIVQVFYENTIL